VLVESRPFDDFDVCLAVAAACLAVAARFDLLDVPFAEREECAFAVVLALPEPVACIVVCVDVRPEPVVTAAAGVLEWLLLEEPHPPAEADAHTSIDNTKNRRSISASLVFEIFLVFAAFGPRLVARVTRASDGVRVAALEGSASAQPRSSHRRRDRTSRPPKSRPGEL
jgi:hypothetical protein